MMNIDVDITHARVIFEKFQNGDDDVVDVTKSRRFELFRVMKTPGPVDRDVATLLKGIGKKRDEIAKGSG